MTWASDAIWDPAVGNFVMNWTCNLKNGGWHIARSYTSDFRTFITAERILSGTGMEVTIWRNVSTGAYYHRAKNGLKELIEQTKASSLYTNCWMVVKNQLGSGTLPKGEGLLLFLDNIYSVIWHLWINDYAIGRGYAPFDTVNIAAVAWEPAPSWHGMLKNAWHGYLIGI